MRGYKIKVTLEAVGALAWREMGEIYVAPDGSTIHPFAIGGGRGIFGSIPSPAVSRYVQWKGRG